MPRLSRNLDILSRIVTCVAVLFSVISGLTLQNRLDIRRNRNGYETGHFVVTGAHFQGQEDGTVEYWLTGTIAGREERFFPRGRPRPGSARDLLAAYPQGAEIGVIYNPQVSDLVSRNGERLRVIQAGPDFWEQESSGLRRATLLTVVPIPLALAFFFFVRRRRSQGEPCVAI